MIYAGSIIFVEPMLINEAKSILKSYDNIEIFAVSDDQKQIVVAIETEDDGSLDELCRTLRGHDEIVEVAHHIFHFEEDVEEILQGRKVPSLDGFSKSSRKRTTED